VIAHNATAALQTAHPNPPFCCAMHKDTCYVISIFALFWFSEEGDRRAEQGNGAAMCGARGRGRLLRAGGVPPQPVAAAAEPHRSAAAPGHHRRQVQLLALLLVFLCRWCVEARIVQAESVCLCCSCGCLLLRVSYAARALGVKKHMAPQEVRRRFPSVTLVHVHTVGENNDKCVRCAWLGLCVGDCGRLRLSDAAERRTNTTGERRRRSTPS
jgi:radical SAM protein with 4Fe4S-binding SPASM domain